MAMLKAKLAELERLKRLEELDDIRGEQQPWGSAAEIRSHVMQPVPDGQGPADRARGRATSRASSTGDLDPFMEAYLHGGAPGSRPIEPRRPGYARGAIPRLR